VKVWLHMATVAHISQQPGEEGAPRWVTISRRAGVAMVGVWPSIGGHPFDGQSGQVLTTLSTTGSHSCGASWRTRVKDGYQRVVSPSRPHRQSRGRGQHDDAGVAHIAHQIGGGFPPSRLLDAWVGAAQSRAPP
jgi:hypothetical protein